MNLLAAIRREERKLEKQAAKLQRQLNGLEAAAKALGNSAGRDLDKAEKRVMSAAARARISRAQKKRWATVKAGVKKAGKPEADGFGTAKKRVMSAAARAKISAAAKRRWAKVKAGARKAVS